MINKFSLLKLSKLFLYLAPFTILIVYRGALFPFIGGKYFFFRVIVELALISFLWAWAIGETRIGVNKDAELWRQPLVIAVSVFTLIFLLAGFLGYNPSASFWSNFERGEGGLQILHLFIFFILLALLFKDEKSWRKMLTIYLWAAGLMIAYGLEAAMRIPFLVGSEPYAGFTGSLGNRGYVGACMIFSIFFAAILLNEGSDKYKNWLKLLLSILLIMFFVILIFSINRGALLGLGVGIIAGMFYFFFHLPKRRMKKITLAAIIILIILGWVGFKYLRSIDLMSFCKGSGNRILNINLDTKTFRVRLLLWKQALKIAGERPILGWGPENFSPAFEKYSNTYSNLWYDRAHNIFLDYLTQTGILGLLSYLSIFAVFYRQFFRFTEKNKEKQHQPVVFRKILIENSLFFSLPIAYLAQAVVLFEVLPIYISLFIFLAFANYGFNK